MTLIRMNQLHSVSVIFSNGLWTEFYRRKVHQILFEFMLLLITYRKDLLCSAHPKLQGTLPQ